MKMGKHILDNFFCIKLPKLLLRTWCFPGIIFKSRNLIILYPSLNQSCLIWHITLESCFIWYLCLISGCEHKDLNPIVQQAWFGFDHIVKRFKCYENVTKTGNNTTCKVWSIIWYMHSISFSHQWKFKL